MQLVFDHLVDFQDGCFLLNSFWRPNGAERNNTSNMAVVRDAESNDRQIQEGQRNASSSVRSILL